MSEPKDLTVRSLTVIAGDGTRTTFGADGFKIVGPDGQGSIRACFAGDGAPLLLLTGADGAAVTVAARATAAGLVIDTPTAKASLVSSGLRLERDGIFKLAANGATLADEAGNELASLPFGVASALGGLLARGKAALAALTTAA
jgi:hypothetical protein